MKTNRGSVQAKEKIKFIGFENTTNMPNINNITGFLVNLRHKIKDKKDTTEKRTMLSHRVTIKISELNSVEIEESNIG